jgi:hypothetical protein
MATWKKILVSGSSAHVSAVTASNLTDTNILMSGPGGRIKNTGFTYGSGKLNLGNTIVSGSIFSGSFVGNGSGLTGLVTSLKISGSTGNDVLDLKVDKLSVLGGTTPITTTVTDNTVTINIANAAADGTTKGLATFDTDDFDASSGLITLGNSANGAVLQVSGTLSEIDITRSNGLVTVGLPNDVVITNDLTVGGDLVVNGDLTYLNVANLAVEDAFILLKSGSSTVGDSGIIFGGSTGIAQSGSALVWDGSYNTNDGRLSVVGNLGANTTGTVSPSYYVAGVYEGSEINAATNKADHPGNIRIDNSEIFIYV